MTDELLESGINKDEILEQISDIFTRYGIRSTSMDDMARYLKMSKKTLYGMFENKNDVVDQVIQYRKRAGNIYAEQLDMNKVEPIQYLFEMLPEIMEKFTTQMPNNIYDVKKYHPELYRRHFQEADQQGVHLMCRFFEKGIADGIFRKEVNKEITSYLFVLQFISMIDPEIAGNPGFSNEEIILTIIENFIRSIATPKGVKELESLIKNRELNNNKQ